VTLYVGVAGASEPDAELIPLAEALGGWLAGSGAVVVCGGGSGVMAAVCRGAQQAGGITVGLLPGADRSTANPYLTVAVATGLGEGRNFLLVRSSDALVAVGGGFGTLSEIALALRTGVPVVGLATWGLSLSGAPVDAFRQTEDPELAAELAVEAAAERARELR
jgi:uncharacterized protein (TIGR00725 family)